MNNNGEDTHLCGFGTDFEDCKNNPRFILSRGPNSFLGLQNYTHPTPPPPRSTPLPPPPPPPIVPNFDNCVRGSRVCYAFFQRGTNNLLCSGNERQLLHKFYANVPGCDKPLADFIADPNAENVCSDGGYNARTIQKNNRTDIEHNAFACDYGSMCQACGRARPRQFTVGCVDSCGLDADIRLHPTAASVVADTGDAFVSWSLDGVLDPSTRDNHVYCRDGGQDSVSGHCNYGTQVMRTELPRIEYAIHSPTLARLLCTVPPMRGKTCGILLQRALAWH